MKNTLILGVLLACGTSNPDIDLGYLVDNSLPSTFERFDVLERTLVSHDESSAIIEVRVDVSAGGAEPRRVVYRAEMVREGQDWYLVQAEYTDGTRSWNRESTFERPYDIYLSLRDQGVGGFHVRN